MSEPYLSDPLQTQNGWEAAFAIQVFHRAPEEWMKMRWGFNAGALLDEALDRHKLFIESQSTTEEAFFTNDGTQRVLVLRGTNLPGMGLQMALLGKVISNSPARVTVATRNYAREIRSTFPYDFLLQPAEDPSTYRRLMDVDFFAGNPSVALIHRADAFIPAARGVRYIGLWQSSPRACEQIWRALSAMPRVTAFNVVMQPTVFHPEERSFLLEMKKKLSALEKDADIPPAFVSWSDSYVKRRLAAWKKYFLLQVQILTDGEMDENLLRSIGSALTRDANDTSLPGFRVSYPASKEEEKNWRKQIQTLSFVPSSARLDDLVDLDEAFSVFRFPYRPEAGLPGANFITQ